MNPKEESMAYAIARGQIEGAILVAVVYLVLRYFGVVA